MNYQIQPRAKVRVKHISTAWIGKNIQPHYTRRVSNFTDDDLIIDPLAAFNPVPDSSAEKIKARWAECGYYGFRRGNWILLARKEQVIVR